MNNIIKELEKITKHLDHITDLGCELQCVGSGCPFDIDGECTVNRLDKIIKELKEIK